MKIRCMAGVELGPSTAFILLVMAKRCLLASRLNGIDSSWIPRYTVDEH